jgi:hypothetical protein
MANRDTTKIAASMHWGSASALAHKNMRIRPNVSASCCGMDWGRGMGRENAALRSVDAGCVRLGGKSGIL